MSTDQQTKKAMMEEALTNAMTEMTEHESKQEEHKELNETNGNAEFETDQTTKEKAKKRASRIQTAKSFLTAEANKSAVSKVYSADQLPLRVGLRISVTEITHIDTTKQQYGIKGYLIYNWPATEMDVVNFVDSTKNPEKKYEPEFKPQLHFVNDVKIFDYKEKHDIKIEYGSDLTPYNSQDLLFFNVIFTEEFNVKNFPFDVQDLRIVVTTTLHDSIKEIRLVPSALHSNQFKLDKTWSSIVTHWEVKNNDVSKAVIGAKSKKNKEYDVVLFRIQVKRRWWGIIFRFVAWLALLGIMSCATFAIDPVEDPSGRLGYAVTMASTVIAFQFFISTYIPEVNYLTLMDAYNWFTFLFVLLIVVQTAILAYTSPSSNLQTMIDDWCFLALGAGFGLGTIGFVIYAAIATRMENNKVGKWEKYQQIARTFEEEKKPDTEKFDFHEIDAELKEFKNVRSD